MTRPSPQKTLPRGASRRASTPTTRLVRRTETRTPRGGARRLVALPAFRVGFVGTLGAAVALALVAGFQTVSLVATYVGVAYFFSLALEPVLRLLRGRGIRRGPAVALIFGFVVLVIAAVVLFVLPLVGRQLLTLVQQAPAAITRLTEQPWFVDVTGQFGLDASVEGLVQLATDYLRDPTRLASLGGGLVALGSGVVDAVVAIIVVLVLTIYLTATMPRVVDKAFQLLPASKAGQWRPVYAEMTESVGRFVVGQVALSVMNAILVFVLLLIFHVPGIALLTAIAFVGALIPIVGTVVAAVIIIAVALITSPPAGIAMIIFYLGYQPLESYVITPRVMARAVRVPGALVLIAVLAGGALGGVLGALVAVPVAASVTVLIDRIVVVRQRQR